MKAEYQASLEDIQKVSKVFKKVLIWSVIPLGLLFMALEKVYSLLGWRGDLLFWSALLGHRPYTNPLMGCMALGCLIAVSFCRRKGISLEARFTERVGLGSKAASYSGPPIILQKDNSNCYGVVLLNALFLLFFLFRSHVFQGGWNWDKQWLTLLLAISPAIIAVTIARFGDWFLASVDSKGVSFSERSAIWSGGKRHHLRWSDLKYVDIQQYRGVLGTDAGRHIRLFDKEHEKGWQIMLVTSAKKDQKDAFIQALQEGIKGEPPSSESIVEETVLPPTVGKSIEALPVQEAVTVATLQNR